MMSVSIPSLICEAADETEDSEVMSRVRYLVFGVAGGGVLRTVPITWEVLEAWVRRARPMPREAPITAVVGIVFLRRNGNGCLK